MQGRTPVDEIVECRERFARLIRMRIAIVKREREALVLDNESAIAWDPSGEEVAHLYDVIDASIDAISQAPSAVAPDQFQAMSSCEEEPVA